MGNDHWPLFDLEVRTPDVTLRYPDDALLVEMMEVAVAGIHDPGQMPFSVPWTRLASPTLEREALRFHWLCRSETRPGSFRLPLAVIVDGVVMGSSDLAATDFATLKQFETGSWLGSEFQGRGIGTQIRRATLALGFDGFGAQRATTTAWSDNPASLGVTRALETRPKQHSPAARPS